MFPVGTYLRAEYEKLSHHAPLMLALDQCDSIAFPFHCLHLEGIGSPGVCLFRDVRSGSQALQPTTSLEHIVAIRLFCLLGQDHMKQFFCQPIPSRDLCHVASVKSTVQRHRFWIDGQPEKGFRYEMLHRHWQNNRRWTLRFHGICSPVQIVRSDSNVIRIGA